MFYYQSNGGGVIMRMDLASLLLVWGSLLNQAVEVIGYAHFFAVFVDQGLSLLNLLPNGPLIGLLTNVLLGLHQAVDQVVDSLRQVGQVSLHVLPLAVGVLVFLIREEVIKPIHVSCLLSVGLLAALLELLLLLVVAL